MVTSREGLEIAQLIFFVPALCVALYVTFRHGFSRRAGWVFLAILSLVRIIGASMGLAYQNGGETNTGLYTGYLILASVGLSPLLLAMLGLLKRVHEGLPRGRIPMPVFAVLATLILVALILAIVGGTDQTSSSQDPATINLGLRLSRAAICLLLVAFVVQCIIALTALPQLRSSHLLDGPILTVVLLSIPFLLVRLLYSLLSIFDVDPANFNFISGNVVVQGMMATFEEFVVVILYLTAGVLSPQTAAREVPARHGEMNHNGDVEMHSAPYDESKGYQGRAGRQDRRARLKAMRPSQQIKRALQNRS